MVVAVAVAVVIAAGVYESQLLGPAQTTTSSGSTTSSSFSTSSESTTTITQTVSTTTGSFTYSPTSPVKIDSVTAIVSTGQNGTRYVNFEVLFENVGATPIFVAGGCGSGLTSSVANSTVIQKGRGGPLCACAEFIMSLGHGQNHTSADPGCWSGYRFQLLKPGSITANLTLTWTASGQNSQSQTSISAKLDLA